jgi:hypothetical protein
VKKILPLLAFLTLCVISASASTVYIAVRTDGLPGSGTQADPFDGSTEPKFDALLNGFGTNTTINISAGTYLTNGLTAWVVKSGWTLNGAGMGQTILKLSGHTDPQNMYYLISGNGVSNVMVSNLTIDGNYAGWNWPAHRAIGGLFIIGSNITVASVESINCYGDAVQGREQFSILLCGSPTQRGTNLLVKNCLTHQYAPSSNYTNGVVIATCSDSEILDCTDDGAIHAFGSSDTSNTQVIGCSASARSQEGYYTDTGSTTDLTLQGNTFQVAGIPIQFNSPANVEGITITDNTLASSNSTGSGGAAIGLTGPGSNVEITNNIFNYTGTVGSGLILDNGDGFTDLDVEDNSSNVGLTGLGGSATSVTSVSTLSGNKFHESSAQLAADEQTSGANSPGATDSSASTVADTPTPAPATTTSSSPAAASTASTAASSASPAATPASTTPSSPSAAASSASSTTSAAATPSTATTEGSKSAPANASSVPAANSSAPAPAATSVAAGSTAAKTATSASTVVTSQSINNVLKMSPGLARTALLDRLLEEWVRQSPAAAASYVQSMSDGPEKMNAEVVVGENWEAIDPVKAMNWIISLPDSPSHVSRA